MFPYGRGNSIIHMCHSKRRCDRVMGFEKPAADFGSTVVNDTSRVSQPATDLLTHYGDYTQVRGSTDRLLGLVWRHTIPHNVGLSDMDKHVIMIYGEPWPRV